MQYMKEYGPQLIANGYIPVPIRAGSKAPSVPKWQSLRLTADECGKYGDDGVGLLCGQGQYPLMALDVDSTNAAIVDEFSKLVFKVCNGIPFERVGRAPKILYLCRAEREGITKMASRKFEGDGQKHQLEILGAGQQFCAYHIHPDTGKPYEWGGLMGEPKDCEATWLPILKEGTAKDLIKAFEDMCLAHGYTPVQGATSGAERNTNLEGTAFADYGNKIPEYTIEDAKRDMGVLSSEGRDLWLKVGMALHFQFDASDDAYEAWDEWSSLASTYVDRNDTRKTWDSFGKANGRQKVGAATIKALAKDARDNLRAEERRAAMDDLTKRINECKNVCEISDIARTAGLQYKDDKAVAVKLIQAKFKELSGGAMISKADVLEKMRLTSHGKFRLTELGNARRMIAHFGKGMMYVPQTDAWYLWDKSHWKQVPNSAIEGYAVMTIESMADEARELEDEDQRDELQAFALSSERSSMFENMRKNAARLPEISRDVDMLDADKNLFACANGVIDIENGKLIAARPDQCITKATGVEFDAAADCPVWKQTIREVFGSNEDTMRAFQVAVGYSMLGNPTEQVIFIPYGNGANGKSTVMSVIRKVFGRHGVTSQADTFVGRGISNAGGPREDLLRLKDARFIYVTEIDEGEELKEGFVKSLTGGEATIARGQHGRHSVEFVPVGAVWMPTNHLPTIKGVDDGIWRRMFPIPFNQTFTADQRDPDRAKKLMAELPGILNWCLEGAREFLNRGRLATSDEISEARATYKSDMDVLAGWLEECCVREIGKTTSLADLFASWKGYGERNGVLYMASNNKKFCRLLKARGFKPYEWVKDRKHIMGFVGIRLTNFEDLSTPL